MWAIQSNVRKLWRGWNESQVLKVATGYTNWSGRTAGFWAHIERSCQKNSRSPSNTVSIAELACVHVSMPSMPWQCFPAKYLRGKNAAGTFCSVVYSCMWLKITKMHIPIAVCQKGKHPYFRGGLKNMFKKIMCFTCF